MEDGKFLIKNEDNGLLIEGDFVERKREMVVKIMFLLIKFKMFWIDIFSIEKVDGLNVIVKIFSVRGFFYLLNICYT